MKLTGLIAVIALLATPVQATYYHKAVAPIAPKLTPGQATSAWCTGGCVWVGGFIAAVAGAIIIHELLGPKCAKPGLKNGYDSPTLWRPLCSDPNVVSVRG